MKARFVYLILTLGVLLPYPQVDGCNPGGPPPSMAEKIEFAMVVVQGTVVANYSLPNPLLPGQYVAEVRVQCILKDSGTRVPEKLNVTNGGPNPGKCFGADLVNGNSYVLFLRDLDTRYEVNAKEIIVQDAAVISKITSTCGLKVTNIYPSGVSETIASSKCPKITNRPCPTTTPPVSTKKTKHPPKPTKPTLKHVTTTPLPTTSRRMTSTMSTSTLADKVTITMETQTKFPEGSGAKKNIGSYLALVLIVIVNILMF